jgi:hypothetical protein
MDRTRSRVSVTGALLMKPAIPHIRLRPSLLIVIGQLWHFLNVLRLAYHPEG